MPDLDSNKENGKLTVRQRLFQLLRERSWSCRELSQELNQTEKRILEHLEHLRLSLRARDLTLQVNSAVCQHCDFTFQHRTRLAKPGRCPECRRGDIEPPFFAITGTE